MELPKNETVVIDDSKKYIKLLLHGSPKVGKTTFATQFPNPIVISTDGSHTRLTVPNVPISPSTHKTLANGMQVQQSGWDYFKETIEALKKDTQFDTIVIDLFSDIIEMGRKHVLDKNGWKHEDDAGGIGKGHVIIRQEIREVIQNLFSIEKNLILITHQKENESKGVLEPDLTSKVFEFTAGRTNGTFAIDFLTQNGIIVKDEQGLPVRVLYTLNKHYSSNNNLGILDDKIIATYQELINNIK